MSSIQQQELEAMFLDLFSIRVALADDAPMTMWMCSECGACVRNCGAHYQWHKKQAVAE